MSKNVVQKCAIAKLLRLHNFNPLDNVTDIFVFVKYVAYSVANILHSFTTFQNFDHSFKISIYDRQWH